MKRNIFQKDISAKTLWLVSFLAAIFKVFLCSFQLIEASPLYAPIDDALMVNAAMNITGGNWLGPYNYLTLSKHSFYALWLAFCNYLRLNIVVAGQLLFCAAAFTLLFAAKPLFKQNRSCLFLFLVVLYTPASWAAFTLRPYRDNIYPALVLLMLAGLLGGFVRFLQPAKTALPFYIVAGLAAGAAWLCHEDNLLLLPFVFCAAGLYVVFVLANKAATQKVRRLALLFVPLAVWGVLYCGWAYKNYTVYGRFIISDYTSSEFSGAVGAVTRVNPGLQRRYWPLPKETRQALYAVSPAFAALEEYLELPAMYTAFGSAETEEFSAGGLHWALRRAAAEAGFYAAPQTAAAFWQAVEHEINTACESGLLTAGPKRSGIFAPFKTTYLAPAFKAFISEVEMLLFFRQTQPTPELSFANAEQTAAWEDYLHCKSSISAVEYTAIPYFTPFEKLAYFILNCFTWVQRLLIYPLIALAILWLFKSVKKLPAAIKAKTFTPAAIGGLLMAGFFLTGLLRLLAVAYLFATSFEIEMYLLYPSAACPLFLAFFAYCAAQWLEGRFCVKSNCNT